MSNKTKVIDFIDEIKKIVKKSKLYSHCKIEKTNTWELGVNNRGQQKVNYIEESSLLHSYKGATIIYLHKLDDLYIYIGSTIGLFNRLGCISSAGSFNQSNESKIPLSNGGKNKDTVVKFFNYLKQGKKLETYAIAFYLNDKINSKNNLDNIIRVPLKEKVEFYFINLFETLYKHKPLLSQGLDQKIAYGV